MSQYVFGNDTSARGCFVEVSRQATGLNAATHITIDSFTFPEPSLVGVTPYMVQSVSFQQKEKFSISECFDDNNYVYAFGHDGNASTMEVTVIAFIAGRYGNNFGTALIRLLAAYSEGRVSQLKSPVTLTIGSFNISGLLVGCTSATADPEHNLQSFTFVIVLNKLQNGATGK